MSFGFDSSDCQRQQLRSVQGELLVDCDQPGSGLAGLGRGLRPFGFGPPPLDPPFPAPGVGASGAGPQGPRGFDGVPGVQGPQGFAGPRGPDGVPGVQGPQGTPGGPQGPPGPSGVDGAPGPQGSAGAQGPPGTSGGPGELIPARTGVGGIAGRTGTQTPQVNNVQLYGLQYNPQNPQAAPQYVLTQVQVQVNNDWEVDIEPFTDVKLHVWEGMYWVTPGSDSLTRRVIAPAAIAAGAQGQVQVMQGTTPTARLYYATNWLQATAWPAGKRGIVNFERGKWYGYPLEC